MQAITTTYHFATESAPAFIAARCAGYRISVPNDSAKSPIDNHEAAAAALLKSLGWEYTYVGGTTHDGSMVWVAVHGSPLARGAA